VASFNGNSYCKPETPAERGARRRANIAREKARIAVLSLNDKTKLLAEAIVGCVARYGEFSARDGALAGLTPREVETLFPAALEIARGMEPRLTDMVAA
jgi:hypothetical protein